MSLEIIIGIIIFCLLEIGIIKLINWLNEDKLPYTSLIVIGFLGLNIFNGGISYVLSKGIVAIIDIMKLNLLKGILIVAILIVKAIVFKLFIYNKSIRGKNE